MHRAFTPDAPRLHAGYTAPSRRMHRAGTSEAQRLHAGCTAPARRKRSTFTPDAQRLHAGYTAPSRRMKKNLRLRETKNNVRNQLFQRLLESGKYKR
jgi:hypothetical protein